MHGIGLHRAIDEGMTLPAIVGESILALINITLPDGTVNEYAAGITCSEVITGCAWTQEWLFSGIG